MNRKALVLVGILFAIPMCLSAQEDGRLNMATLLQISNSSISNIGNIVRPKGFSLQHTREYADTNRANTITQEVIWGFRATFDKENNRWLGTPSQNPSAITIHLEKGKITPFQIVYNTNDVALYNSFFNDLVRQGFKKVGEWIETSHIMTNFENEQTKQFIVLVEFIQGTGSAFKYVCHIGEKSEINTSKN